MAPMNYLVVYLCDCTPNEVVILVGVQRGDGRVEGAGNVAGILLWLKVEGDRFPVVQGLLLVVQYARDTWGRGFDRSGLCCSGIFPVSRVVTFSLAHEQLPVLLQRQHARFLLRSWPGRYSCYPTGVGYQQQQQ